MATNSEESADRGPGAEWASFKTIITTATVLGLLTVGLMASMVQRWPNCDLPADPPPGAGPLRIASITPNSGGISGNDVVALIGGGFTDDVTVSFDGTPAKDVKVQTAGVLTTRTPAHAAGRATVEVGTPGNKKLAILTSGFVYLDPEKSPARPRIDSLTPTAGPHTGGQHVTVTGTGFSGIASVAFGGVTATDVVVRDDSTLAATTPAHTEGKVDLVVSGSSSATLSEAYTFSCWAGMRSQFFALVILAGALGGALHALRSLFWYVGNRDLRQSWILMYLILPINGAAMAAIFYLVIFAGLFTVQGSSTYLLLGVAALVGMFSSQASEKLKKIAEGLLTDVRPGADTVTPKEGAASDTAPRLTLHAIRPRSGETAGGTAVAISGSQFASGATVTFNGVGATGVAVPDAETITAKTPPHAAGDVEVVVTNPSGAKAALPNGFTYADAPRVTIAPNTGPRAGGTSVTIKGKGFTAIQPGPPTVMLGGVPATSITVVDDSTITADTPSSQTARRVDVAVDKVTLTGAYTYT